VDDVTELCSCELFASNGHAAVAVCYILVEEMLHVFATICLGHLATDVLQQAKRQLTLAIVDVHRRTKVVGVDHLDHTRLVLDHRCQVLAHKADATIGMRNNLGKVLVQLCKSKQTLTLQQEASRGRLEVAKAQSMPILLVRQSVDAIHNDLRKLVLVVVLGNDTLAAFSDVRDDSNDNRSSNGCVRRHVDNDVGRHGCRVSLGRDVGLCSTLIQTLSQLVISASQ